MVQSASREKSQGQSPVQARPAPGAAPVASVQTKKTVQGLDGFDAQSAALAPVQMEPGAAAPKGVTGGPELFQAQMKLNKLKFSCGTPDGIMGNNTRNAIIAFQKSKSLDPTGTLDDKTLEALEAAVNGAGTNAGAAPGGAANASQGGGGSASGEASASQTGGSAPAAPGGAGAPADKDTADKKDPAKSAVEGDKQVEPPANSTPKAAVASGAFRDKGKYKVGDKGIFAGFQDGTLQSVLDDLVANWAKIGDPNAPADAAAAAKGGDSSGKSSGDHPSWVKAFQEKLMGLSKEQWGEDAEAAQKLCEAFLLAWGAQKNGGKVPGNVAALMGEVGGSESNKQAQHLGGWTDDPSTAKDEGKDWCAEASNNAVIIGLMRAGLRFSAIKPWKAGPVLVDIKKQAEHFVVKWAQKHGKSDGLVEPGDIVSIVGHGPASGHVATVAAKEDPNTKTGKMDIVSGNAGGVRGKEGAVRAEQVTVVEPPGDYNYTKAHTNDPSYKGPKKAEREPPGHVYLVSVVKASKLDPSALLATIKDGENTSEQLKNYGLEKFDAKSTFTDPKQQQDLKNYVGI